MASSKLFLIVVAFCAIQLAPCAADVFEDVANLPLQAVKTVLEAIKGGLTQAGNVVQTLTDRESEVLGNSKGPLQDILNGFTNKIASMVNNSLEFGKDSTTCVEGQEEYAKNLTLQAGKNIFACTQTQIQQAVQVLASMTTLGDKAMALLNKIPEDISGCIKPDFPICIFQHGLDIQGQVVALGSTLAADLAKLATQGVTLPEAIVSCGTDQIFKATTQVGDLVTKIGKCVQTVAQKS